MPATWCGKVRARSPARASQRSAIGSDDGRQPEPGKPFRPYSLLLRSREAGYHDRPFAKVDRFGERIVAAHADDDIGGLHAAAKSGSKSTTCTLVADRWLRVASASRSLLGQ